MDIAHPIAMPVHARAYIVCPSVCLSIRPSVPSFGPLHAAAAARELATPRIAAAPCGRLS